ARARGTPCGFSLPHPERHVQAARCCVADRSSGLPRCAGGACSGRRKRGSPASTRDVRPGGGAKMPFILPIRGTIVPCEACILWYSADKTSSRKLRDTTK